MIVTSPERAPLDEAIYFAAELKRTGMSRRAVVVNRMHPVDPDDGDEATTTARLRRSLGSSLAGRVARTHSELQVLARRDDAAIGRLRQALDDQPICVADRAADVNDTDALVELQGGLFRVDHYPSPIQGSLSLEPSR